MPEEGAGGTVISTESESSAGKWVLLVLAILYVVGSIAASIYYFHDLNTRLSELDKNQQAAETQIADLVKKAQASEASEDTLAQQLGMTKKELASRSAELQRQQRAAEERLTEEQKKQIGEVSGDIANVKPTWVELRPMWLRPRASWPLPRPSCKARSATSECKAGLSPILEVTSMC
jgi:uncharacterized protein HemX